MVQRTAKTVCYFSRNKSGRNQYQNLGPVVTREYTSAPSILDVAVTILCLILLVLLLWNINVKLNIRMYPLSEDHVIFLNPHQSLLHTTSKRFLSFGLDSSLLRDMKKFPIQNERFANLTRHLSPAFVRVGGTSADCLTFNEEIRPPAKTIRSPVDGQDISNFSITSNDFKSIYDYTQRSHTRLMFDLNVLIRNSDGTWNSTNAREIISFAKGHDMDLDWQLGNEPNSFHHVFNVTITAKQLAQDYITLRQLLSQCGYDASFLVGPEVNHIGEENRVGENYAQTFLENNENSVDYVTWHQYYLNGHKTRAKEFLNVSTFNYLPMQIESVSRMINASGKRIGMWLSETSSAYGGGAPGLSDRFLAGFLWLDKLGYSARTGVNVVIRQSLFGGHYAMVGPDLEPNPDWWVSVLYKQFVSEKVLKLAPVANSDRVRLYAHCTPEKALINKEPALTIYGINIGKTPVGLLLGGIFRHTKIHLYALTAAYLLSRDIQLNGQVLKLRPNSELPQFQPIILESNETIVLPAYSMVYIVTHGAEVPACLS